MANDWVVMNDSPEYAGRRRVFENGLFGGRCCLNKHKVLEVCTRHEYHFYSRAGKIVYRSFDIFYLLELDPSNLLFDIPERPPPSLRPSLIAAPTIHAEHENLEDTILSHKHFEMLSPCKAPRDLMCSKKYQTMHNSVEHASMNFILTLLGA